MSGTNRLSVHCARCAVRSLRRRVASSLRRCAVTPTAWWQWLVYIAAIVVALYCASLLTLLHKGFPPRGRLSSWLVERTVFLYFLTSSVFPLSGFLVFFLGGQAACV